MKQLYVDDYVGTILSAWYTRAARWVPAEDSTEPRCEFCAASPLIDVIDIYAWPHELIHQLAASLGAALGHIEISLCETSSDALAVPLTARRMVAASLWLRAAEMSEVLEDCVLYRIGDLELMELERSLLA